MALRPQREYVGTVIAYQARRHPGSDSIEVDVTARFTISSFNFHMFKLGDRAALTLSPVEQTPEG